MNSPIQAPAGAQADKSLSRESPPHPGSPRSSSSRSPRSSRSSSSRSPRSSRSGSPRYACFELSGLDASPDAAAVFAAAGRRRRFLWMQPRMNLTLVGIGAAQEWRPPTPAHFESTFRQAVEALTPDLASDLAPTLLPPPGAAPDAPRPPKTVPWLYGGFGFYASTPRDWQENWQGDYQDDYRGDYRGDYQDNCQGDYRGDWRDFPESCLVLPKILGIDRGDGFRWYLTLREGCPGDFSDDLSDGLSHQLSQAEAEARALLEAAGELAKRRVDVSGELAASAELEESYRRLVRTALGELAAGNLDKVVAARRASVQLRDGARPPLVRELLVRLSERFETAVTFAVGRGPSTFLGSTPELLLRTEDGVIESAALAGSRPRSPERTADDLLVAELLANPKERSEHAAVVEHLYSRLHSAGVSFAEPPGQPAVNSLPGIHHLYTSLRGKGETPPGELWRLAALLHPTPAVGGSPTAPALDFLRSKENFERGWFASPLGYCDLQGNGESALSLRCGLLREDSKEMAVFAGAGVMANSTPEAELAETHTKLGAMLSVLDPTT